MRARNERLAALLSEAGWSRAQAASAFNRVAQEAKGVGQGQIGRSHLSMWVGGTQPSGAAPVVLCQALSRRLRRQVTLEEAGFTRSVPPWVGGSWDVDPRITLAELGSRDLNADRRSLLAGGVYSVAALVLPGDHWWQEMAQSPCPDARPAGVKRVGRHDVETVRNLTAAFSRMDQSRGGGHGRRALAQYLHSDVSAFLGGRFPDERVRQDMFGAAGELAYLSGWMAFDNAEHALAQRYFAVSLKLAAQADNPPLAGHILRAMAHQAIDLGFFPQGLHLSSASVRGQRYASATPREKALLGVVHARGLASNGRKREAAKALLRAEDDLSMASVDIEEPHRTFFFSEASLAHETACTLRDSGDSAGAIQQFRRSVRTRGTEFRRTHAVTLGYMGAVQIADGSVEEACTSWGLVLDAMEDGIYSGRARQAVVEMQRLLSPYRNRDISVARRLRARATAYLAQVD